MATAEKLQSFFHFSPPTWRAEGWLVNLGCHVTCANELSAAVDIPNHLWSNKVKSNGDQLANLAASCCRYDLLLTARQPRCFPASAAASVRPLDQRRWAVACARVGHVEVVQLGARGRTASQTDWVTRRRQRRVTEPLLSHTVRREGLTRLARWVCWWRHVQRRVDVPVRGWVREVRRWDCVQWVARPGVGTVAHVQRVRPNARSFEVRRRGAQGAVRGHEEGLRVLFHAHAMRAWEPLAFWERVRPQGLVARRGAVAKRPAGARYVRDDRLGILAGIGRRGCCGWGVGGSTCPCGRKKSTNEATRKRNMIWRKSPLIPPMAAQVHRLQSSKHQHHTTLWEDLIFFYKFASPKFEIGGYIATETIDQYM